MVAEADPAVTELVRRGWDAASRIYRPDASLEDLGAPAFAGYRDWLAPVFGVVRAGAPVLDLGCGCGVPAAALSPSGTRSPASTCRRRRSSGRGAGCRGPRFNGPT